MGVMKGQFPSHFEKCWGYEHMFCPPPPPIFLFTKSFLLKADFVLSMEANDMLSTFDNLENLSPMSDRVPPSPHFPVHSYASY